MFADLLRLYVIRSGAHTVLAVADGAEALDLMARSKIAPDLILADYNLPGGMDGLTVAAALQTRLKREIPVVILTGDITDETTRAVASAKCVQLTKTGRHQKTDEGDEGPFIGRTAIEAAGD